mgnify:FL=1
MNYKIIIVNIFFLLSLLITLVISLEVYTIKLNNLVSYYALSTTIPLFILQLLSINKFSRLIRNVKPKLFKKACIRPNGSEANSINVASLFDEKIPFSEMKEKHLIYHWKFTKRVVVYSMLSFLILIILFFI